MATHLFEAIVSASCPSVPDELVRADKEERSIPPGLSEELVLSHKQ